MNVWYGKMKRMTIYERRWAQLRRVLVRMRRQGWIVERIYTRNLSELPEMDMTYRCADVVRVYK